MNVNQYSVMSLDLIQKSACRYQILFDFKFFQGAGEFQSANLRFNLVSTVYCGSSPNAVDSREALCASYCEMLAVTAALDCDFGEAVCCLSILGLGDECVDDWKSSTCISSTSDSLLDDIIWIWISGASSSMKFLTIWIIVCFVVLVWGFSS